ncbi:TetR/AcrR family transcriptional regulator [Brachybacterium endophyticum]|uniref:TetR/AcrR family transcriptional regulator n=1 Tax=Brachybacterium endophyticum TaxID=2182385 RepID=UPI001F0C1EF7|nr:TetR/AcrR family transcriptional regulator [Brachybacterium endophyticum]
MPVRPGRPSRREQIIDGAAEVLAEYGYHGSSLRHIATHVGITHPGMLHHFASKHDLLGAVIDRMEAHAQKALNRLDELSTDRDSLLQALSEVWDPCSASIQLLATLDADIVSRDHPGRYRVARLHRVHEHVLQECFAQLDRAGLLRPGVDPAFMARSTLALVLSHAMREKTVRMMQGTTHDDAPLSDVTTLVGMFLKDVPADVSTAD